MSLYRNFALILYPDSEDYSFESVLETLSMLPETNPHCIGYLGICHNSDSVKPHWHFILRFDYARSISACANELGIAPNYVQSVSNLAGARRYLIHADNPEKAQYSVNDCVGTESEIDALSQSIEMTGGSALLSWVYNNKPLSFSSVVQYALKTGAENQLRKYSYVINILIKEWTK